MKIFFNPFFFNNFIINKNKISSYLDENVLTFPAESKINSLFNEVHKYKIVIFNKPTDTGRYYYCSAISYLKLFKNDQELTIKSISSSGVRNATAILTDGEKDYTVKLVGGNVYEDHSSCAVRNAFYDCWLSSRPYPTTMTLEFEMGNLTKISYVAGKYSDDRMIANKNDITISCDDVQIYSKSTTIPGGTNKSQIHINFNDYDDVNVTYTV